MGLTGSLAGPSAEYNALYKMWAKQINADGGLLGRDVKVIIKNDNSTAATATTQYQFLLTSEKVDLVVAPYATFIGAAIVPLVKSSGKLIFNGGFTDTATNEAAGGRLISSYAYQPKDYSRGLFEAIKSLPSSDRPTKVGILTNNNPFTLAVRDGFDKKGGVRAFARAAGMKIVFDKTYSADTTDFTSAVSGAKSSGADMFFVLGLPEDSTTILKSVKTVRYQPKITCACGSQVSTLANWSSLGTATEGIVSTTGSWPTQKNLGMDVLNSYAEGRGEKVIPTYTAAAYANLQVLEQAVKGAKTLDQDKLSTYIYGHTFDTVVGPIKFAANGTAEFRQVLIQTNDGKVQPIWPTDVAESEFRVAAGK